MLNLTDNTVKDHINTEELHSMAMLNNYSSGKRIAKVIIVIVTFLFVIMFFPWQQNIFSTEGSLTALKPQDRPQTIESAIAGRIIEWRIAEGEKVNKGDTILILAEIKDKFFDPELLIRLKEQLKAKQEGIASTEDKVGSLRHQIEALKNAYEFSTNKAVNKLEQYRLKVTSDSIDLEAEKIGQKIAEDQFKRSESMYEKGLISAVEIERRKVKFQETTAKIYTTQNKLNSSRNDFLNAKIEFNSIKAEYSEKISKAESDLNATIAYVHDAEGQFSKLRNEYSNMEIRASQYFIVAPQTGTVVKALKSGLGQTIKEGEAVVTIMPANPSVATEIYVYPMDVPLLSEGRKVRLQFDGFPALQFSGWPSVAVGTFGGLVKVIDFVESSNGKFRVLVVPDPNDTPWPNRLRMGVGAKGWIMLDDVPIWYEFWRQMNGFPPSLKKAPEDDKHYYEKKK